MISGDQSTQKKYVPGRAQFSSISVTCQQTLVGIVQFIPFTTCGSFGSYRAYGLFGAKLRSDPFGSFLSFHAFL